jgi:S-adenosylmethionine:tRNA ribosyltransferase-isomerase
MQKEISLNLQEYVYDLPDNKIAFEGSTKRDESKLLHYQKGKIKDRLFHQIVDLIPTDSTLVFNNTKVIPARIQVQKETGANIEIFLLKPAQNLDISQALSTSKKVVWSCMIGNLKKWKENEAIYKILSIKNKDFKLTVTLLNKEEKIVEFSWSENDMSFGQLIDLLGNTPLPPYIKRNVKESDKERYQTVYSKVRGAVAAPTAGLHFTNETLAQLSKKGVIQEHLTLHVGAGTFMPIKSDTVWEHPMHNETMLLPIKIVESLINSEHIISVGTTSMRTLESLYWFGVKLLKNPQADFKIDKLYPYENHIALPTKKESFKAILNFAKRNDKEYIDGSTEIFIFPGYKFKVCDALITNFHQPESTLILLVAAFVGKKWRDIYAHALQNNYRFLSFGDSSYIVPN